MCKEENSGGVDREKSHIDYTKENSKPCCSVCNSIKSSFTDDTFTKKIHKIFINLFT